MPQIPAKPAASTRPSRRHTGRPFLGLIDTVLVQSPVDHAFDGAVSTEDATAAWLWMVRDLAPDLIDLEALEDNPASAGAVESRMPNLLAGPRKALPEASTDGEASRRI